MAITSFSGPVRSLNGFITYGSGAVVNIPDNTNTVTVSPELHGGSRIIRTNDATLVITLPAIIATPAPDSAGPGGPVSTRNNIGISYNFFVETTATNWKLGTNGIDRFVGSLLMVPSAGGAASGFVPAASNDFINFNGSTTGGIAGTWLQVTAVAPLRYFVQGVVIGSGVLATPFADA
ncbi:MAG: hypothetical protein DDT25_00126 [Chloroflexi bacterium]|nr:hypothetical protein [Chloroflexota bacterium]